MKRVLLIAALIGLAASQNATAGDILDRVRRHGVVRCTADERPAVAMARVDGGIDGLAVELCRAVAIAVLGRDGRVTFAIDGPAQNADVDFVTAEQADGLSGLIPGPVVFVDRLLVLVPVASLVRAPRDLSGQTVCLMIGSPGQNALEAMVRRLGITIVRLAFEEADEMHDAYAVGRCAAMVGSWTELSKLRGPMGVNGLASRLVAEPLARVPITAATDATDRDWATIVSWVGQALEGDTAGGTPPAGIRPGWPDHARGVVAEYRAASQSASGEE